MTKSLYSPDQLDSLAVRVLDVSVALRSMARQCRSEGIDALEMHDRKALLWLEQLEEWSAKVERQVQSRLIEVQAERRAREFAE